MYDFQGASLLQPLTITASNRALLDDAHMSSKG